MCRKKIWIIVLFLLGGILTGCGEKGARESGLEEVHFEEAIVKEELEEKEEMPEEDKIQKIYVHICGHVRIPGVYELDKNSRVYEAIQAAGGMSEQAAEAYINQAAVLEDGQRIYIPSEEEIHLQQLTDTEQLQDTDSSNDDRININTADKEKLMQLTGIGEKRAEAIVAYRQEHGRFQSTDELMQVEGIKQGVFDKLKDQIKIE